jgi:putative transposase
MSEYRRPKIPGVTWFLTVNLAERRANHLLADHIGRLRKAFRTVKTAHPFRIDAILVLPDRVHCVWTLPEGNSDYATRWGLIKAGFSRGSPMVNGDPEVG